MNLIIRSKLPTLGIEKMHTEHSKSFTIHHTLADIKIDPRLPIIQSDLKRFIHLALDNYHEKIPAKIIHAETQERHGAHYQTAGYYLKLYRVRKDLTQKKLADSVNIRQHHLSEMEHNKRPIGKKLAKELAKILEIDYRKLL